MTRKFRVIRAIKDQVHDLAPIQCHGFHHPTCHDDDDRISLLFFPRSHIYGCGYLMRSSPSVEGKEVTADLFPCRKRRRRVGRRRRRRGSSAGRTAASDRRRAVRRRCAGRSASSSAGPSSVPPPPSPDVPPAATRQKRFFVGKPVADVCWCAEPCGRIGRAGRPAGRCGRWSRPAAAPAAPRCRWTG